MTTEPAGHPIQRALVEVPGERAGSRETDHILSGIAHEIRNALFTTGMTLEALEAGAGSAGFSEIADSLRRQLEPLQELAADLALLEDPPTGGFVALPFVSLLGAALERLNGNDNAKKGAKVEIAEGTVGRTRVMAEASSMVRALEHVLAYAAQRSPAHIVLSPLIRQTIDREPMALECLVDDYGPPLEPEDLAHVLDPYHPRSRGGFSSRLAAARRVTEAHGGELLVEQAPGGGVRLVVRLPCVDPS